ncbi:YidC/Oxa1 family membrane protein insertase [Anaerococcus sp. AGMB00486]|uniref:YidC/Oxa1 family membrane protein insertase n=2 Tax=Anaerococcus TaxID=165779 RepID=A0ABX2N997_9FIRM|nr:MULTISPECIES: YidC/Oxa1 family membrane protein insertase [Anaerococcus]MDY3005845.1 YidC/Oxa1 family membrane protein insertase [Anaerococcus porci]MSS77586.1 YidC/Oxa1 family membrane protein insertase [Anaerococcus porci]NVF11258.1 YidC/Oxa1 family membrane protein insertase [Anaerococcus faecalis]
MLNFIAQLLGSLMKLIYETLVNNFTEPESMSFYAISIIIMTALVSLITIPMTMNQQKQAAKSSEMQPKIEEIKKKYSYDPQIMQQKMQEFYKQEGVGPGLSSCLVMIFQLLILLSLYRVIQNPDKFVFDGGLHAIRNDFLWVPSLSKADPLFYGLPLLTSISQLLVQLFTMKTSPATNAQAPGMGSMNTMLMVMPIMYYFIFRGLPAGLPLYWTTSSIARLVILGGQYLIGLRKRDEEVENEKINNKNSKN